MPTRLAGIPVAQMMRSGEPTLAPGETLTRAMKVMASLDVRELPVTRDGALVGILAYRDLAPFVGHFEWTTVQQAMTPDPVRVTPDTLVGVAARLLLEHRFNCLPVANKSSLIGMIGRGDLLRLLIDDVS